MTENGKFEALIKWLATHPLAQAPDNTDGWIDKHMKMQYPELNTPSGDWGLHRLLDRAFTAGYIQYQEREDCGQMKKWYSASSKGVMFADELIKREKLFDGALTAYDPLSTDAIMDMVLFWFAIEPKDYKGGMVVPRTKVPAEAVGSNIVEFYFRELNNVDFVINLDLILDQLSIDGYLFKHNDDNWRPTYSITYKGKKFMKNGGYRVNDELIQKQKKIQLLKENLLISGTWFAGVAGILLVINEVLKNFHWVGTIEFWMTFAVFSFGIIGGIIIYLLISHFLEKKE